MRRKSGGPIVEATAESVALERGLYGLKKPPQGLPPDAVDQVWGNIEADLPAAIERVELGIDDESGHELILDYIAGLAVRHPEYFRMLADQYHHRQQVGTSGR